VLSLRILYDPFYRIVGQQKSDGQGEGGNGGETSMAPITGDGNGE
jgi:hypothetical protein